jgi:group I intron endonuclease
MYYVYCHTFPNGKRYVGITRTSPERRWGKGRNYNTCPLMDRAIQKYGCENIKHDVIDTAESREDAEAKERHYIELFMSDRPEHGYNILPGGDVANNPLTDEIRYKLGTGQRGRNRTDEEKSRISAGVREKFSRPESNGHLGMHHDDSTRQKMSESQMVRWSENQSRRDAASERMRQRMGETEFHTKIVENLSQYRRKPGEWTMSEEAKAKLSNHNRGKWVGEKSPCSKPVLQYDVNGNLIKRWENASEVERAGIANRSNVSACCRGKAHVKTVAGFVWKFEE